MYHCRAAPPAPLHFQAIRSRATSALGAVRRLSRCLGKKMRAAFTFHFSREHQVNCQSKVWECYDQLSDANLPQSTSSVIDPRTCTFLLWKYLKIVGRLEYLAPSGFRNPPAIMPWRIRIILGLSFSKSIMGSCGLESCLILSPVALLAPYSELI